MTRPAPVLLARQSRYARPDEPDLEAERERLTERLAALDAVNAVRAKRREVEAERTARRMKDHVTPAERTRT